MLRALIIFFAMYASMLIFSKARVFAALGAAALFIALGILPLEKAPHAVDWNVIMMIGGTMGTVSLFIDSKMPALMADVIIEKMPDMRWTVIALSAFSGLISAFVDNVATVLMIAPVAVMIAKKLKISPVPSIIAIAVASNLQGAATLVGDTTSILLGGYAGMNFLDFFFMDGRPGLFWIVEIGALAATAVLFIIFRKDRGKVDGVGRTEVTDYFPSALMIATLVLLIAASFFKERPALTNGIICVGVFLIGVLRELFFGSKDRIAKALKEMDYQTLLLLVGLFIVIEGITEAGVIDAIAGLFVRISGDDLFLAYTLIVWVSVLFSAFVDNIPYVATMLPVVTGIAGGMGTDPKVLYFGLLIGATLGGNLTPVGASANITAIGILRREGYDVKTREFTRIGVPYTLTAVVVGYVLTWIIWS